MTQEPSIEPNVRQHGRHLMGVALVAIVASAAYTLWCLAMPWWQPDKLDPALLARHFDLVVSDPAAMTPAVKALLVPTFALTGLQALLPLFMLHRLGRCFSYENALDRRTAVAVRRLSHSIVASLVLLPALAGFLFAFAQTIAASTGVEMGLASSSFDSPASFLASLGAGVVLPLVACICLYSLAWLIRIGADAADDARSIV